METVNDKMRKDLQKAHELAAEANPLSHYKELLQQFQEELEEAARAQVQAQSTPAKKPKKGKTAVEEADVDGDIEMAEDGGEEEAVDEKKSKKRKASEEAVSPQHWP